MEQYKEGTVFVLYENDPQEYIILKRVELEEDLYLVVVPVSNEENKLKMDTKKLFLLKVNKGLENIEIECDNEVIKKVIDNLF